MSGKPVSGLRKTKVFGAPHGEPTFLNRPTRIRNDRAEPRYLQTPQLDSAGSSNRETPAAYRAGFDTGSAFGGLAGRANSAFGGDPVETGGTDSGG